MVDDILTARHSALKTGDVAFEKWARLPLVNLNLATYPMRKDEIGGRPTYRDPTTEIARAAWYAGITAWRDAQPSNEIRDEVELEAVAKAIYGRDDKIWERNRKTLGVQQAKWKAARVLETFAAHRASRDPSDARVEAACEVFHGGPDKWPPANVHRANEFRSAMRAALKAAQEV